MRYVQLRAFHDVAIHGGFSRAASALSLTQPALSDQVRKLEEAYDVLLFNREKKQVTLTQAGRQLLEMTRRMFDSEQQVMELLEESRVAVASAAAASLCERSWKSPRRCPARKHCIQPFS